MITGMLNHKNRQLRRIAASLITSYQFLRDKDYSPDYGPILSPFKGVDPTGGKNFISYLQSLSGFLSRKPDGKRRNIPYDDLFLSTKGGPFGKPLIAKAHYDAYSLLLPANADFLEAYLTLYTSARSLAPLFDEEKCRAEALEELRLAAALVHGTPEEGGLPPDPSRLAGFQGLPERGAKIRIITKCNYWLQSVLVPYDNYIREILRDLGQDLTYDQEAAIIQARTISSERLDISSFDASGATERAPLESQKHLFSVLFGSEAASS